jgi:SAM-dependent methyltransferase
MSESPESGREAAPQQPAYHKHASSYDWMTGAYQGLRRAIVSALPARPGQVILDVGCGTGLCFALLLEKVGPAGGVIGIDESAEMTALARERIAREHWHNVTVLQARVEDAPITLPADGALFCAVHDILQSEAALRHVIDHLRPGAGVAAGGGKWAAPWLVAVNVPTLLLHAPYVRSFKGFHRPWSQLEPMLGDVHIREMAFGSGFLLTGHTPP